MAQCFFKANLAFTHLLCQPRKWPFHRQNTMLLTERIGLEAQTLRESCAKNAQQPFRPSRQGLGSATVSVAAGRVSRPALSAV
jgi:hypothetical protein